MTNHEIDNMVREILLKLMDIYIQSSRDLNRKFVEAHIDFIDKYKNIVKPIVIDSDIIMMVKGIVQMAGFNTENQEVDEKLVDIAKKYLNIK